MKRVFEHLIRRKVEFSETDMAGIVHFSNFFRWMEAAEADFFRFIDEPLIVANAETVSGWPRVRASCAYHAPVAFGDEVEICLVVKELKIRAIAYSFRFYKLTDGGKEHIATGEMTTVFAQRRARGGPMESASIPIALQEKIEAKKPTE